MRNRTVRVGGSIAGLLALAIIIWLAFPHIHRKPPSIFDTPVDGVLDYLASPDFNKLSIQERMDYLAGILQRFGSMSQSESVVASSFFAGLTGPANEKLVTNARVLGKDIFVQGAQQFLALNSPQERDEFIDKWVVQWVRFAEQATGKPSKLNDQEILSRMGRQATRDVRRIGQMDGELAIQMVDFWQRDIASVASPREQAQIIQFAPAIRQRMLTRGH